MQSLVQRNKDANWLGVFFPSVRERHAPRSSEMGPLLQAGRHGHVRMPQEPNKMNCSAFWGQTDLFLTCAQAVSGYGFYSGHWTRSYDFSLLPFHCSPLPSLPGSQPQRCNSLSHVISHAGQVKYFP